MLSVVGGTIISYMFIKATYYVASYYDGLIWPGRFIGFASGIFTFAFLTHHILGESISPKTMVSLILALVLLSVQIFWK